MSDLDISDNDDDIMNISDNESDKEDDENMILDSLIEDMNNLDVDNDVLDDEEITTTNCVCNQRKRCSIHPDKVFSNSKEVVSGDINKPFLFPFGFLSPSFSQENLVIDGKKYLSVTNYVLANMIPSSVDKMRHSTMANLQPNPREIYKQFLDYYNEEKLILIVNALEEFFNLYFQNGQLSYYTNVKISGFDKPVWGVPNLLGEIQMILQKMVSIQRKQRTLEHLNLYIDGIYKTYVAYNFLIKNYKNLYEFKDKSIGELFVLEENPISKESLQFLFFNKMLPVSVVYLLYYPNEIFSVAEKDTENLRYEHSKEITFQEYLIANIPRHDRDKILSTIKHESNYSSVKSRYFIKNPLEFQTSKYDIPDMPYPSSIEINEFNFYHGIYQTFLAFDFLVQNPETKEEENIADLALKQQPRFSFNEIVTSFQNKNLDDRVIYLLYNPDKIYDVVRNGNYQKMEYPVFENSFDINEQTLLLLPYKNDTLNSYVTKYLKKALGIKMVKGKPIRGVTEAKDGSLFIFEKNVNKKLFEFYAKKGLQMKFQDKQFTEILLCSGNLDLECNVEERNLFKSNSNFMGKYIMKIRGETKEIDSTPLSLRINETFKYNVFNASFIKERCRRFSHFLNSFTQYIRRGPLKSQLDKEEPFSESDIDKIMIIMYNAKIPKNPVLAPSYLSLKEIVVWKYTNGMLEDILEHFLDIVNKSNKKYKFNQLTLEQYITSIVKKNENISNNSSEKAYKNINIAIDAIKNVFSLDESKNDNLLALSILYDKDISSIDTSLKTTDVETYLKNNIPANYYINFFSTLKPKRQEKSSIVHSMIVEKKQQDRFSNSDVKNLYELTQKTLVVTNRNNTDEQQVFSSVLDASEILKISPSIILNKIYNPDSEEDTIWELKDKKFPGTTIKKYKK